MLVALDWQHQGKPYAPTDRGAAYDQDGDGIVTPHEHEVVFTGMDIIWGMTKRDSGWWEGGRILDPANGKVYGCKLRVTSGGSKLEVRGFLGISLLGRTQTWNRLR